MTRTTDQAFWEENKRKGMGPDYLEGDGGAVAHRSGDCFLQHELTKRTHFSIYGNSLTY